ncbi:MAG: replicative DNA helicase [Streptococcaceae bacterium]|jgi:replicative DNA helicase|nr:replicative DNA helicase [Streptococcaceae bacterium]
MAEALDTLRTPPQDLAAEQAVLGAIFLDSERLIEVSEYIKAEDFYRNAHRVIFRAMTALSENSEAIDLLTVRAQLELQGDMEAVGGISYLTELVGSVPTAANATYYARIVAEKSQLRQLIRQLTDTVDKAYNQENEATELVAAAEKDILDLSQGQVKRDFTKVPDIINDAFDQIEERSKSKTSITGLPSYYQELDKLTTGFHEEELIILAARPGVGKTAFALNIAENVATRQDKAVAIFSLEMGVESLVDRLIASTGPIDANHIRTGQLTEDDWSHLTLATSTLSKAQIYVDDTPGIRISEIRAKSRKLAQETGNLALIVIDYLQLISGNGRENRQQEVSEISRQLKILAKELKVPVVALSQLSRGVESREDKRPRLSDLRESGSIEQDADIVAFLYREDYYNREGDDEDVLEDNTVEIIVEKNRQGSRGTAKLLFKKEFNKFANLDYSHEERG